MKASLVATAVALGGCAAGTAAHTSTLMVRACNDTGHNLLELVFQGFTEGPIAQGACSPYRETAKAYRYTDAQFKVNEDKFWIHPTDDVGEKPLAVGRWSYHLTITDYASRRADIRATRD